MSMEQKTCKKCKRILPEDYKYNCCEACRNDRVHGLRKIVKVAGPVLGVAGSAVAAIIFKNSNKSGR